ncbi:MAG: peptidylprolyl isomerase [Actinobacteria bacterium]|nr:peptidylprolyl isomerase [Actinomycetota bacterium]
MAYPFPALDGSAPKTQKFNDTPEFGIDPTKRYTATMDTSMGQMVIALDAVNAPNTVNNFVFLAGYHYYDGIIFHRIINGFVCQGGDPGGTGTGGPGYRFNDEPVKTRYQIGSLAMANAGPNTNGSQFFLISGPSGVGLPPQYPRVVSMRGTCAAFWIPSGSSRSTPSTSWCAVRNCRCFRASATTRAP